MYLKFTALVLGIVLFNSSAFAKLPLTLPAYAISSIAEAQVTISPSYSTAAVSFYDGNLIVYKAILLQSAPKLNLPANLNIGDITLQNGILIMNLPSTGSPGKVTLTGTSTSRTQNKSENINVILGTWTVNQ